MPRSSIKLLVLAGLLTLVVWSLTWFFAYGCNQDWCLILPKRKIAATTTFAECQRRGFPVHNAAIPRCTVGKKSFLKPYTPPKEESINVQSPRGNSRIASPFVFTGTARVFEPAIAYRLKDEDGTVLAADTVSVQTPNAVGFGSFSASVTFPPPKGKVGRLEISSTSASGSEKGLTSIPLFFALK